MIITCYIIFQCSKTLSTHSTLKLDCFRLFHHNGWFSTGAHLNVYTDTIVHIIINYIDTPIVLGEIAFINLETSNTQSLVWITCL